MNEKTGAVFSVTDDNPPIPGCTVSKEITDKGSYIAYYSLANGTDISAEIYPYHKFIIVDSGNIEVYYKGKVQSCKKGDAVLTLTDIPVGVRATNNSVYTEIMIRRSDVMNPIINAGEVFKLSELVPYADGKIVNMDVVHNEKMKFVIMAFDAGTGLSEHAAPGEALIFALDGEGIIGYEGKEHTIKTGENFHFAKSSLHYVKANKKFKMALLLTLE